MALKTLKKMSQDKGPKFGHYVGEFVTPGIGHILASAKCDFVFFDMEHSGFEFETPFCAWALDVALFGFLLVCFFRAMCNPIEE